MSKAHKIILPKAMLIAELLDIQKPIWQSQTIINMNIVHKASFTEHRQIRALLAPTPQRPQQHSIANAGIT